ncbi:MAG: hypothetical protein RMK57_05075 [Bryobacterales bacterium]|nr:hypothetical protein [Bryobacteraceae bacterium]MDW8353886.1 hypothetical protein [Bryobacterales bacterium]
MREELADYVACPGDSVGEVIEEMLARYERGAIRRRDLVVALPALASGRSAA